MQRNREGVQRKERVQRKEPKRACAAQRSCAAQLIVCSAIDRVQRNLIVCSAIDRVQRNRPNLKIIKAHPPPAYRYNSMLVFVSRHLDEKLFRLLA